ncbi:MAG: carbon storage regulator CsrA [Deltaproteobacteria bacterium]|nr:carbon storage regulator CsrA [Deltaproteobacteria bacterium]
MLVLTRKIDESITIGHSITISVLEVKGNQVKLGVKAPKDIPINRTEVYEKIMSENIKASEAPTDLDQFLISMDFNEEGKR